MSSFTKVVLIDILIFGLLMNKSQDNIYSGKVKKRIGE